MDCAGSQEPVQPTDQFVIVSVVTSQCGLFKTVTFPLDEVNTTFQDTDLLSETWNVVWLLEVIVLSASSVAFVSVLEKV